MMTFTKDGELLHIVHRADEIEYSRKDLCPDYEGLQVACFRMDKGKTFRAHQHIPRPREIPITQETWIILSGAVEALYYDTDGEPVGKEVLMAGDISITFKGGHNYRCIGENTRVVEVKTGPFVGVEADKEFLDEGAPV